MIRKGDWTDAMRDALRDAEAAPEKSGWERLERELPPAPRMVVLRNRRLRIAAAAAAVLILAATGEWLWRPERVQIERVEVIASAAGGGKTADRTTGLPASEMETVLLAEAAPESVHAGASSVSRRPQKRAFAAAPTQAVAAASLGDPAATTAEGATTAGGATAEANAAQQTSAASTNAPKAARAQSAAGAAPAASGPQGTRTGRALFSGEPFIAHARPRSKASFGLFAGGGVSGSGNASGVAQPLLMQNPALGLDGVAVISPRIDYTKGSFRHHQPLSLGLSVRKEFPYGLSLESGVVYTLLRSDVELFAGTEAVGQRLHLIGIPLRLNWQFLERGRFSLYIGAGGMAEKCVSASFGSLDVEERGLQWSVVGAAGAQYRLGGVVGLYFEPEVSYYFTETSLRTARTDSPLSLSLRLGVRLSF